MGAEDADRLARLHQQRLVAFERPQRAHDGVKTVPVAGCPPGAAIDHQIVGPLGHLGVEVVHEHSQGCLLLPSLARYLGSARCAHGSWPTVLLACLLLLLGHRVAFAFLAASSQPWAFYR